MLYFRPRALAEAGIVGGVLAVFAWLVSSQFKSPVMEHFMAGALMHLSLELMGVHHYFAQQVITEEKLPDGKTEVVASDPTVKI